jgi:hypothetical protein
LFIRAERLLTLGCPLVWVLWPEKQKAWEYRPGDLREMTVSLTHDKEPDVSVPLPEMWARMERQP